MATVQNTIEFIKSHGFHACETAEGVLALMDCVHTLEGAKQAGIEADDRCFDEPAVFPIIDGNVSSRAVRAWLGY